MKWDIEGVVINKKLFPCGASTEVEKTVISSGADNIAAFTTNERKPLTSLAIDIEPSQEGTGDPSPDNVRPLVSYDKVTAKIQKGTTKVKEVVSFGTTVYGLTGDCVSGEFEETWSAPLLVDGSFSVNAVSQSGGTYFVTVVVNLTSENTTASNTTVYSDKFVTRTGLGGGDNHCYITNSGKTLVCVLADQTITTKAQATQWFEDNPTNFVYKLATPTELTTDPVTITTFTGEQTVRFDEKIPFTLKYLTLENDSCDIAKQFLPLFYNNERRSL